MVRTVLLGALLFPVVVLAAYPVARFMQRGWVTVVSEVTTTRGREWRTPPSIYVTAGGEGRGASVRMTWAHVYLTGGGNFTLNVDLRRMVYRRAGGGGPNAETPLTREALAADLEQAGFGGGSAEAAAAVEKELVDFAAGRLPASDLSVDAAPISGYRRSYMVGTYRPRRWVWWPWFTLWCVPAWLVAWFVGCRLILRWHRARVGRV